MELLAAAAIAAAFIYVRLRRRKGKANFGPGMSDLGRRQTQLALTYLAQHREHYTELCRVHHLHLYAGHPDVRVEHLLYDRTWLPPQPPPLCQVPVRQWGEPYPKQPPRPCRELPDPRLDFARTVMEADENITLQDLPLYGLRRADFRPDGQAALTVWRGTYFDFYNQGELRAYQMAYAQCILGEKVDAGHLPAAFTQGDPMDLSQRFAGVGVSTLTVLHGADGAPRLLLHRRGNKVAEGRGRIHCVPAGSFAPGTAEDDSTLCHTVLREWCEEVLGLPEGGADAAAREKQKALRPEELRLLGLGLDLLNGKAEVMCVLHLEQERLGVLFPGGKTPEQAIAQAPGCAEGEMELTPFTLQRVTGLLQNPRCTPTLRQMLTLALRHLDDSDSYRMF